MTLPAAQAIADKHLPLAGKTVAVVHAAWHSCGSYQVNVAQAAAYTQDMPADERFYANMPGSVFAKPAFWSELYWPLIHGDHARSTAAMTKFARLPSALAGRAIDLIHCNHFFCIPAARNLSATAPLVKIGWSLSS